MKHLQRYFYLGNKVTDLYRNIIYLGYYIKGNFNLPLLPEILPKRVTLLLCLIIN